MIEIEQIRHLEELIDEITGQCFDCDHQLMANQGK